MKLGAKNRLVSQAHLITNFKSNLQFIHQSRKACKEVGSRAAVTGPYYVTECEGDLDKSGKADYAFRQDFGYAAKSKWTVEGEVIN